ncbi:hypothetical protein NDR87_31395 [Nocardia sp. CDC159]|uniref:DUF7172 domain-containing protein n=1 Tax=Nocardia pulmonis TaxID=2951408 RepID=A0A9X2EEF6_9NOCA|nr:MULTISPECIES: hypothetical protein [Nocardia]MCM6777945.1 hypothetical protein [Nocardia pulmonis]MCM6790884.1 hypothetical protein [Nocardia sp. CDC159]
MTFPCVDTTFFDVPGGVLSPKRQWQWQHRASATGGGATFTPANNAAGTTLFTVQAAWTNTTGVSQRVYAVMTQGPVRYVLDGLKHMFIRYQWGTSSGVAPADPTLTEESRVRGYPDFGSANATPSGPVAAIFVLLEDRQPTASVPIGDLITLPTGQTMKARVQVSWATSAWGIDWYTPAWGDPVPNRVGKVGPVRVDLFSVPMIP